MSDQEIERLRVQINALKAENSTLRTRLASSNGVHEPPLEPWLDTALAAGGVGLFTLTISDQVIHPSASCCLIFGLPVVASYPASAFERLVLASDKHLASGEATRRRGSAIVKTEYRIARADDGAIRHLERSAKFELDAQGRPVRLTGAVRDITLKRQAETAVAEREAALQAFSDGREFVIGLTARQRALTDPDTVMRLTAQALGERLDASRVGFYRALGQDRVQYINGWSDGSLPLRSGVEQATASGTAVAEHRAVGTPLVFGDSRHDEGRGLEAMAEQGVLSGLVVPLISHQRWHAGLYVDHSSVRAWTPMQVSLVREVAELAWLAVERAEALVRLQIRLSSQHEQIAAGHRQIQGQRSGREIAESQVRQLQKMEAVGLLTGGIAHDFNNMLAVVVGALNLMERKLKRGDADVLRHVDTALDGARRAATLTSRLLSFSRQQPLAPVALDCNRVLSGMTDMLTRTLGELVQLEVIESAGLWVTKADPHQLENALLNLAVNARDAMPGGGKLTIETANVQVEQSYADEFDISVGHYVKLSVTDTGIGMTADVMARAFDPFFTTKGVGKGTGLGLSQVFGFAGQSGGHIRAYSEPGHGSTFRLYLPRHWGDAAPTELLAKVPTPLRRGRPEDIVLVVEDEERLRAISVEALRELGYTVVPAANGPEALALIDAGQGVTLLFTDIVMPEMSGRQLADLAVVKLPGLKVIYTTGYTKNAVVHDGVIDAGTHFLPKPFSIDELAAMVAHVLNVERP